MKHLFSGKPSARNPLLSILHTLVLSSLLTACGSAPVKQPQNNDITILPESSLSIDSLKPQEIVVAANKSWQSSGLLIDNGEQVFVKATGKWSPAPLMLQWSGGEGNSLFGAEVPYINGAALMARLGHNGVPFEIGINKTFQANDYGMLYFAMNDPFEWQYDNEGELSVAIYTSTNKIISKNNAGRPTEIVAYNYNDKTSMGTLSARVNGDHFKTRNWMIKKIGEIASSKQVAILAGKESLQGGNYRVLDESTEDGIIKISFETLW